MKCDKCNLDKEYVIGAYSKSKGYKQYCGDCFQFREQPIEAVKIFTDYEVDSVANRDEKGNEI